MASMKKSILSHPTLLFAPLVMFPQGVGESAETEWHVLQWDAAGR